MCNGTNSTTEHAKHKLQRRHGLNIVAFHGAFILKLLAAVDEALLTDGDLVLPLDFLLYVEDSV